MGIRVHAALLAFLYAVTCPIQAAIEQDITTNLGREAPARLVLTQKDLAACLARQLLM